MVALLEMVLGVICLYFGLQGLRQASRAAALLFGLLAILGVVLVMHGVLIHNVPDFFADSM